MSTKAHVSSIDQPVPELPVADMAAGNIVRRLRGVLGNALVWGGGWFAATFAVLATLRVFGFAPAESSWGDALRFALRSGVMGAIAGTAFSSFIALRYRGRRLSEISWVRFGIGGAVVTGLFVPAFLYGRGNGVDIRDPSGRRRHPDARGSAR